MSVRARAWRRLSVALACLPLAGCTTTVHAPPEIETPARVALLDHGQHSSLVIEVPGERPVRWAYGDWRWYAQARTGAAVGTRAVLLPTPAALGRKELPGPLDAARLRRQVAIPIEHLHLLEVEAARARALRDELDGLFAAAPAPPLESPVRDLAFVPHPRPYTLGHNSNRVVADWLAALGAEIEGPVLLSRWRVRTPAGRER